MKQRKFIFQIGGRRFLMETIRRSERVILQLSEVDRNDKLLFLKNPTAPVHVECGYLAGTGLEWTATTFGGRHRFTGRSAKSVAEQLCNWAITQTNLQASSTAVRKFAFPMVTNALTVA